MFTGIVEELGTVETPGARLTIQCSEVLDDLTEGASIAVNGVCLTAIALQPGSFSADLAPETLRRSNLGDLRAGARVNLERPVTPATRLSGHIVQGHVDGTGELLALDPLGDDNWWLRIRVPAGLERYLVFKGSIAIDGISLTIASLGPRRTRRHHHPAHLPQHNARPAIAPARASTSNATCWRSTWKNCSKISTSRRAVSDPVNLTLYLNDHGRINRCDQRKEENSL